MPRSFDANSGRRINQPKVAQGPPVPNQGGGVGLRQPRTIDPVQPRGRKDEIMRPHAQPGAQPTAAPSHTKPVGPPGAQGWQQTGAPTPPAATGAPPAAQGWSPAGAPGAFKTAEQYQGPQGEKISIKPSPEQQAMQAAGGGDQPMDDQGAVAPPMQPSPLGPDSPLEAHATAGGFRLGQNAHVRKIAMPDMQGMSREQQMDYERKAVRDFQSFGAYEGMDDPNSPPPPIKVGGFSFNPESGHWVEPEGHVSVLKRMAAGNVNG